MAIQFFGSSKSFDTKKAQRRGTGERHLLPGQNQRLIPPRRGQAWLQTLSLKKIEVSRKRDLLISRDRT